MRANQRVALVEKYWSAPMDRAGPDDLKQLKEIMTRILTACLNFYVFGADQKCLVFSELLARKGKDLRHKLAHVWFLGPNNASVGTAAYAEEDQGDSTVVFKKMASHAFTAVKKGTSGTHHTQHLKQRLDLAFRLVKRMNKVQSMEHVLLCATNFGFVREGKHMDALKPTLLLAKAIAVALTLPRKDSTVRIAGNGFDGGKLGEEYNTLFDALETTTWDWKAFQHACLQLLFPVRAAARNNTKQAWRIFAVEKLHVADIRFGALCFRWDEQNDGTWNIMDASEREAPSSLASAPDIASLVATTTNLGYELAETLRECKHGEDDFGDISKRSKRNKDTLVTLHGRVHGPLRGIENAVDRFHSTCAKMLQTVTLHVESQGVSEESRAWYDEQCDAFHEFLEELQIKLFDNLTDYGTKLMSLQRTIGQLRAALGRRNTSNDVSDHDDSPPDDDESDRKRKRDAAAIERQRKAVEAWTLSHRFDVQLCADRRRLLEQHRRDRLLAAARERSCSAALALAKEGDNADSIKVRTTELLNEKANNEKARLEQARETRQHDYVRLDREEAAANARQEALRAETVQITRSSLRSTEKEIRKLEESLGTADDQAACQARLRECREEKQRTTRKLDAIQDQRRKDVNAARQRRLRETKRRDKADKDHEAALRKVGARAELRATQKNGLSAERQPELYLAEREAVREHARVIKEMEVERQRVHKDTLQEMVAAQEEKRRRDFEAREVRLRRPNETESDKARTAERRRMFAEEEAARRRALDERERREYAARERKRERAREARDMKQQRALAERAAQRAYDLEVKKLDVDRRNAELEWAVVSPSVALLGEAREQRAYAEREAQRAYAEREAERQRAYAEREAERQRAYAEREAERQRAYDLEVMRIKHGVTLRRN